MLSEQAPIAKTRVYRELNLRNSALADEVTTCAERVFSELGPGFSPTLCEEALAIEFSNAGIQFMKGHPARVSFRGQHIGEHRFNFVVEERIAVRLMGAQDDAGLQTLYFRSYLKACSLESGLLLNFSMSAFSVRRIGRETVPTIADEESKSASSTALEIPFTPSLGIDIASDGPSSFSDPSENPAAAAPQDSGGGHPWKRRLWIGLLALSVIVATVVVALVLPARRLERARTDIENRFVQSVYLDSETSRRLAASLVTGPDISKAAEIAKATKFLCDALFNGELSSLQSEAATDALTKVEGKDGRNLPRELVPLRDIVREVRLLCDVGKVFGDSRDPKDLEKRLAGWQERIFRLRRSTFLNVQLFRAEYLISVISANAENEFKKRAALAQSKE